MGFGQFLWRSWALREELPGVEEGFPEVGLGGDEHHKYAPFAPEFVNVAMIGSRKW